jgi:hypothetical protein
MYQPVNEAGTLYTLIGRYAVSYVGRITGYSDVSP